MDVARRLLPRNHGVMPGKRWFLEPWPTGRELGGSRPECTMEVRDLLPLSELWAVSVGANICGIFSEYEMNGNRRAIFTATA
jgi:hypothetical protein